MRERTEMMARAPKWARILRKIIVGHYRLRRLCAGIYSQAPFDYSIYTAANPTERQTFHVSHPTIRWIR
jgi:hypothetical protein